MIAKPSLLVIDGTKITSGYAAEIWGKFARKVLENKPITDFPVPAGVSTNIVSLCGNRLPGLRLLSGNDS